MTKILKCDCTATKSGNPAGATFQDERYGAGMRVHNSCKKGESDAWRCTICGTVR